MTAPERLAELYAARPELARDLAAGGTPVVGVVGADVPAELVEAAGAVAYRLHGSPDVVSDEARAVLGAALDPVAHSVLTRLLDGSLAFLAGLVVSRDSQASLQLFYALRELRRLEPGRGLPPVVLLDLLHLPTGHTARYDEVRLRQLAGQLTRWTGTPATPDRLAGAVGAAGEVRALLREVGSLRREARLTGTTALHAVGVATALPAADAVPLLRQVVVGAVGEVPAARRVFVTGSGQDTDELYRALEQEIGCLVVGEDHDWGASAGPAEPAGADLAALGVAYRDRGPAAPTASIARRAAATAEAVRGARAELLLAVVREHDEAPAWDFPAQAAAVDVPAVLLARQPYRVDLAKLREVVGVAAGSPS
ncbi:2-hydroxyacyl-CoA dehydratase family protein [Blastococcus haudaquaticus]|uniref:Benzoyl-CoA reductase/2-hydroxyglutaryl-CoA dehydratase subunit, BcrC/BadD/HgdB n=1 Tax=Blastococcus haudaquaticus TaxID=1938745 RepID=A0A286GS39_9ACTN|nr:2-hydroxyacyl-CoA dehydratase family protein [Blastococcus haudaquaticus]SOD98338.1 Benzoyl-CoA reductase/2-hydroxyglutaryl-CoA dehydratase subunit, BcrC/BadD/HgdB [Blastococcus haudaquaticus]